MARLGALPEAIIPLRVKQTLFVKARKLKLMIDVRGQHKIIPTLHNPEQVRIGLPHGHIIAIDEDLPAPPCPVFLQRIKRIKTAGIHVPDAVFPRKIGEVFLKALSGIGQPCGRGKAGSCADDHGVRIGQPCLKPLNLL